MTAKRNASQVLDRHYLEARARILEIAAILDRIDRADGTTGEDPRADQLRQGIRILLDDDVDRAQRVQHLFSRKYSETWRKDMGV